MSALSTCPTEEEATCATSTTTEADRLSRRSTLARAGGLAAAALGAASLPAEAAGSGEQTARVACVLAPEMTEGPYYLPGEKVRRNITEGLPGAPLDAAPDACVDASTCKPIKGAAVDIWHASAAGKYSGEAANGTVGLTFLRGIQRTDANGLALFKTVYPGWYQGRAVHIHVKVHVGGERRAHRPAVLPRRLHGRRLPARALQRRAGAATCATPTTRSTSTAAAARCCACARPARATSARSAWACAAADALLHRDVRVGVLDADHAGTRGRARAGA